MNSVLRQQAGQRTLSTIAELARRVKELEQELAQARQEAQVAKRQALAAQDSARTAWRISGMAPHAAGSGL